MSDLETKIVEFFQNSEIAAAFLFGSHAKKKSRDQSDVDIAILYEPNYLPEIFSQLQMKEDLENLLKKDVDLIVMNQANPIFKHQIFKYGRLLFCKNQRFFHQFFSYSLMEYDDIKRVRLPIEQNLLAGRCYG